MSRAWGVWTKLKLEVLSEYLDKFVTAAQIAPNTVYLDLFAGQVENTLRDTQLPIDGSAARALQTKLPFSRVILFERPARAAALEQGLKQRFPDRAPSLRMWPGDCNNRIDDALADLVADKMEWAATFAFLDQQGPDVHWATLEKLARHRAGRFKTELWLFFGSSLLPRGLGVRAEPNEAFARRVDTMLGTTHWRTAYDARVTGKVSGQQFRAELDNWMRWRLERALGYTTTHTIPVHDESGREIYTMIFATDNDTGDKIMRHLYGLALREFPHMLREAQDLRAAAAGSGVQGLLFPDDPALVKPEELYTHTPPWRPHWLDAIDPH